jgi:hypothetical protein
VKLVLLWPGIGQLWFFKGGYVTPADLVYLCERLVFADLVKRVRLEKRSGSGGVSRHGNAGAAAGSAGRTMASTASTHAGCATLPLQTRSCG